MDKVKSLILLRVSLLSFIFILVSCSNAPIFNPPAGVYNEMQKVTITPRATGINVYSKYTIDGTDPDCKGKGIDLAGEIILFVSTTLKMISCGGISPDSLYSADYTINWTLQNTGITSNLNDIQWTGNQFIVVGDSGTILTSPDGSTWTPQNSGVTTNLNGVSGVSDGSLASAVYIIVGDTGTILTSSNGTTWTVMAPATSQKLRRVKAGYYGATVVGDTGIILNIPFPLLPTIPGGIQQSETNVNLNDVTWTMDTEIIVGDYGTILRRSLNSSTWTAQVSGTMANLYSINPGGNEFYGYYLWPIVAAGSSGAVKSSDGTTWRNSYLSDFSWNDTTTTPQGYQVAVGNGFFSVSDDDATTWKVDTSFFTGKILNAISSTILNDKPIAVAVGNQGEIYTLGLVNY